MANPPYFHRYKPIVNNWPAFQDVLLAPLPTCIWTNPLRTTPRQLAKILQADAIPAEPLDWYLGAFKLPANFKPGYHWAYQAGLYHVQEEVSLLPVIFLNPQPGERILDLCAAPGNKSAQIAVKMSNSGTVVANDINFGRMRAVRQIIERLGLVNISTTTADGANYPKAAGLFDRVLVDVPCSCEGTSRKEPGVLHRTGPDVSDRKSGLQKALLRKAIQRCKAGGRIVYATCTYAPEENEMVVDAILREYGPETVRVVPARGIALAFSEGVTRWQGRQLHPSGGFFVAVLEKVGLKGALPDEPAEAGLPQPAAGKAAVLQTLAQRFGLPPDTFAPYRIFKQNAKRVALVNQGHRPPVAPQPDASGISFVKTQMRYPKPSTAAAMIFGPEAQQNYIDLDRTQAERYLARQNVEVLERQTEMCTGTGYLLVRHGGFVLGVGMYYPADTGSGGLIRSMFPKGWIPTGVVE